MRFSHFYFYSFIGIVWFFVTKVNIGNNYTLEFFGKLLIPCNPLDPLKKQCVLFYWQIETSKKVSYLHLYWILGGETLTSRSCSRCFLVSRQSRLRPKESRPSVRMYVRKYLWARSSNFYETWQLDRTCIGDKNVPSGFLN